MSTHFAAQKRPNGPRYVKRGGHEDPWPLLRPAQGIAREDRMGDVGRGDDWEDPWRSSQIGHCRSLECQ
jgi:hypothetical protein